MNVVLGVGGGIAAYKSAELARGLMERGMRVQVVMTDAAQEFITPLTFAGLTGPQSHHRICSLPEARRKLFRARSNISRWRRTTKSW